MTTRRRTLTGWQAYCLVCNGGGKVLHSGSKVACEHEATSHGNLYGHNVTILDKRED